MNQDWLLALMNPYFMSGFILGCAFPWLLVLVWLCCCSFAGPGSVPGPAFKDPGPYLGLAYGLAICDVPV